MNMDSDFYLRVRTGINAPVSKVWEALTTPELIKQYFFGTNARSDWKVGSPITFKGEWRGKTYEDKGTILAIKPRKLLRFGYWGSMSGIEDKPENYVPITYELSPEERGTTLTLTQKDLPDEKMMEQNWKKVFKNLKELLENW